MSVELQYNDIFLIFKFGLIIFAVLYFIFTLMVVKQVRMMTGVVVTEAGSGLRALSVIYAGLALAVMVLFWGFLI